MCLLYYGGRRVQLGSSMGIRIHFCRLVVLLEMTLVAFQQFCSNEEWVDANKRVSRECRVCYSNEDAPSVPFLEP